MNVAKVKKNIANLKKIKDVINISKFDTLHQLQTTSKITNTFFDMAMISKGLVEFAEKKYPIISALNSKNKKNKTVWIFATVHSSMFASSYVDQEAQIRKGFNVEYDSLMVIGEHAIKFAQKSGFKTIYKSKTIDQSLEELPSIISSLHNQKIMTRLKFVSNSSQNLEKPITIIPMRDLNIKHNTVTGIGGKYKFLPSLSVSLGHLSEIYVERLIEGLSRDVKYFHLKEKLLRAEEALKSVDKKIEEKTREMRKMLRKIETEELTMVSQVAKRGGRND